MWFYFCLSIVIVNVISTNLVKNDPKNVSDVNKETEAIFAGVIKNISRVNNVLQELISNYEHLQKIYKSQENLESASSDDEIDEVYKNVKRKRSRAELNTDKPVSNFYPATQMIWSGDDKNEDASESDSNESNDSKTMGKPNKAKGKSDINLSLATSKDESLESDDTQTSESGEIPEEEKPQAPKILNRELIKPKKSEIFFVDTHKINHIEEKNVDNGAPESYTDENSNNYKTRYSKVSHSLQDTKNIHKRKNVSKDEKNEAANSNDSKTYAPGDDKDNIRKVEKTLHSETFSPKNIWDDIIRNKPIKLEAHNEITFEKMRKDNRDTTSKPALRLINEKKTKTAIVIVRNKKHNNKTSDIKLEPSDISENDEGSGKDEFQASVLREAYGDACLKLVVRKCFKACKAAGKSVCERFKCKSTYKERFNEGSKTACIKQFNRGKETSSNESDNETTESSMPKVIGRRSNSQYLKQSHNSGLSDLTREGYFETCLPHIQETYRRSMAMKAISVKNTTPSEPPQPAASFESLNILRDKYERACKKASYRKCNIACKDAYQSLCESFTCNSARKKSYKKSCTRECKKAYKLKYDSSSSSSSSGSSSDSHSSSSHSTSSSE